MGCKMRLLSLHCKRSATLKLLLATLRYKRRSLYFRNREGGRVTQFQRRKILGLSRMVANHRRRRKAERRWWVRPIFEDHDTHGAWASLLVVARERDPDEFYNFMRMTPKAFDELLGLLEIFLQKNSWRKYIVPGERLAITLRYLASGDSARSLQWLFRVSNQCISTILSETTTLIWHVLKDVVFPPLTEDTWLKVAADYEAMWDFPHAVGAIDGKHVRVRAPPHSGSRCFNYKKFFSFILLAVVDAKQRFLIVDIGGSGRRGDGNIFHTSALAQRLVEKRLHLPPPCPVEGHSSDMPFVFLGDGAFESSENMLNTFRGKFLEPEERVFNYRHCRGRHSVENAFGIMVSRFEILQRAIRGSEALAKSTMLATVALHNYHLLDEESVPPGIRRYCPAEYADYYKEDGTFVRGRWKDEVPDIEKSCLRRLKRNVNHVRRNAIMRYSGDEVTEEYVSYFVNNPLPWQWKKAFIL